MNWYDFLIIISLIIGAFLGFKSGLTWQVIRIVSWIAALLLAGIFHLSIADLLSKIFRFDIPSWVGYLLIIAVVILIFYIIARTFTTTLKVLHLELFDKIGGALLSCIKVLLILSAATFYIYTFFEDGSALKDGVENSFLASNFLEIINIS